MKYITIIEDNLKINNVPTEDGCQSFSTVLNVTLIKAEMKRLKINECDYEEFRIMYK